MASVWLFISLLSGCFFDPAKGIQNPILEPVKAAPKGPSAALQHKIILAQLQLKNGDWLGAQQSLQKAKKLAPQDPWLYAAWGEMAWEKGDSQEAIKQWKHSIRLFGMHAPQKRAELHKKIRQASP